MSEQDERLVDQTAAQLIVVDELLVVRPAAATAAPGRIDEPEVAPVLITEAEVMLGTAAAVSPTPATTVRRSRSRRIAAAISRTIAGAKDRDRRRPRPLYPAPMGYLDRSRMARELYRL